MTSSFRASLIQAAVGRATSPQVARSDNDKDITKPNTGPTNVTQPLSLSPTVIYEMPKGVWLENLAVRQADGNVLVTDLSTPDLFLFSSTNQFTPIKIASFPDTTGCLGISELGLDNFYLIAGNWSNATLTTTPGTYSIWHVNMTGWSLDSDTNDTVNATKVVDVPQSGFLNGMDVLDPLAGILLVGDSSNGVVWAVDVRTNNYSLAINDTSMAPIPKSEGGFGLGINGVRVRDGYLYYTNSDRATVYRIPVDIRVGSAIGPAEQLANFSGTGFLPDDFAIDYFGNIWMCLDLGSGLALLRNATAVPFNESNATLEIVASSAENATIQGWTSARFGRSFVDVAEQSLYVTTNGGAANYPNHSWTSGGELVKLKTGVLIL